jgi:hypothetical protein
MKLAAQAVPIGIHYHHAWLIWLLFLIGDALHVWLLTSDLANKSKQSLRTVLKATAPALAFRTCFTCAAFGLIWGDPELLTQIAKIFHVSMSVDEAAVFALPMNNAIAAIWGLFLDSAFGYIPFLKSQLPPVMVVEVKQVTTSTQTQVETTKVSAGTTPATQP